MHDEQAWVLKRAKLTPKKIALIDIASNRQWSYENLSIEIQRWQRLFAAFQLPKGARIAYLAENNIDAFALLFACGLSGFLYVPLNWRLNVKELHSIIEDCEPAILLFDESFKETAEQLSIPSKLSINEVIQMGDLKHKPLVYEWSICDPWLIIYTGGTTGKPKGVVLSFEAVNWNAFNTIVSWGLSDQDCTLNYMPLFHTGGINALSIPLLMSGGTVVVGKRFDAEQAIRHINDYKTTISLFVPTMYQAMIETEYFQKALFPTVKVFLSGGAPCPESIYKHFFQKGLLFKEGYGLTEAGPNNFFIDAKVASKKLGSVGKEMLFNEVKIVNDDDKECAVDEVGELLVKGKHLFTAYWNNEVETAKAITEGWLRTGDLARKDQAGDFYIVGRKKEMIITGGENVYPQEVEQCISRHINVKEVAVIGIKDTLWGEIVTAYIVCKEQQLDFEQHIKQYCIEHLGRYKVPKQIYLVGELPKTPVGKIDKKQLFIIASNGL